MGTGAGFGLFGAAREKSLRFVTSRLLARFGAGRGLERCAVERRMLAQGDEQLRSAAIALHGEWERVAWLKDDPDQEWKRAQQYPGIQQHLPTTAYRLNNCLLRRGTLYRGITYEVVAPDPGPPATPARHVKRALLCSNHCTMRFFGHWLLDGLALEQLADDLDLTPIVLSDPYPHSAQYRAALRQPANFIEHARIDELWIVDDRGMNASRRRRLAELRTRLSRHSAAPPLRVFLDRGSWGTGRGLINRDEVVAALRDLGFIEVRPEDLTLDALREVLERAELCVAVEGSALAHAVLLMPEGGTIVTLQPPERFVLVLKGYTDAVGLNFAFVAGDGGRGSEVIRINPARLTALLTQLIRTDSR